MGTTSSNNLLNLHFYCCERLECFPLFKKHFYYCIPCFSASTFELTDAVCYISLSPFLSMRFYTCWLNDCHFLRIMCARCWHPPVRRLTAAICVSVVETGPSLSWFLAPPLDALQSYKVFTQHQYNPSHFSCLRRNLMFGLSVAYQVFSHKLPPSACMDVGRYRPRLQGGKGIKKCHQSWSYACLYWCPKRKGLVHGNSSTTIYITLICA